MARGQADLHAASGEGVMDEDVEPEDTPPPEPLQFDVHYWDQDAANRASWDVHGEDIQMVG